MTLPELPYFDPVTGRSSGWSGSDTSEDRAHDADLSGATMTRQERAMLALSARGPEGFTCTELLHRVFYDEDPTNFVRPLSGVLSNLHNGGEIARLTGRRGGEKVYVALEHVGDRVVEQPRRNLNVRKIAQMRRIIAQADERGLDCLPLDVVRKIIEYREKERDEPRDH